ncbi:Katanin p80 WD40 repeat-containing subunit B1 [Geranomyces variabilis]|nr:Katanin p80 WD40 repeat-containing subunit B1 [Geranomyces variabilis]
MNNDSRASKIHDFVAHDAAATCLKIGGKSARVMVTGGEDRKVNLWAVGKTTPILSLAGHASTIECVTLDWPEEIVVAGSASGTLKLWDLEQAKVIRTLAGHKQNARCVEFHPFGEFFASGSQDSSVKIWDVRRKGCIQTYEGHAGGVTDLRITPDGRWIATGGNDSQVKIWDMTAGKLLHTYKDHGAPITSLAFNPSEFMMVTAAQDNTLRFYDLQSFECISATPAATGRPQVLQFDPEGQELYVGYTDSLQIWTWEPAECHDVISVNWPNITDMRVMLEEGQVLAGALDQNFVSMWGVDITPRMSPTERRPVARSYPATAQSGVRGDGGEPDIGRLTIADNSSRQSTPRSSVVDPSEDAAFSKYGRQHASIEGREPPPGVQPNVGGRNPPYSVTKTSSSPYTVPPDLVADSRPLPRSFSANLDRFVDEQQQQQQQHNPRSSVPNASSGRASTPQRDFSAEQQQRQLQTQQLQSHSSPQQSRSRNSNVFVPRGTGHKPLNLDVAKFIQNAQRRQAPLPLSPTSPDAPPPTSDADVQDALLFRHTSVASILHSRLASIRMVRAAWDEHNIRPAIEAVVSLKDASVLVDVLRILNVKPKLLSLDAALLVLPMLHELFFEVYEDYIIVACETIRHIVKAFAQLILASIDLDPLASPGVDVARDDRIQRCRGCYDHLVNVANTLEELKRSAGQVGVHVRDALKDLAILSRR